MNILEVHQKKIINAIIKYNKVSVVSANGIGKSLCLSGLILLFFYTHLSYDKQVKTIVVFTAPTFAQVKDNLYYNIKSFIESLGTFGNEQVNSVKAACDALLALAMKTLH